VPKAQSLSEKFPSSHPAASLTIRERRAAHLNGYDVLKATTAVQSATSALERFGAFTRMLESRITFNIIAWP
jgi:hypothetical protein